MIPSGPWAYETVSGSAAELHQRSSDFSRRLVRVNHVVRPAVVLSSTQSVDVMDMRTVERLGLDVVKRSSGGGLVHLGVEEQLWVDFFLPRGDELWVDDVGRSSDWLGRAWVRAFDSIGLEGAEVTAGRWSDPEIGRIVCFAATGPGEVVIDGRKLVGVSQRRTRQGARFQSTLYRTFDPGTVMSTLDESFIGREVYRRLADRLASGVVALDQLLSPAVTSGVDDVVPTLLWELVEHLP